LARWEDTAATATDDDVVTKLEKMAREEKDPVRWRTLVQAIREITYPRGCAFAVEHGARAIRDFWTEMREAQWPARRRRR
jgi:hypothetical protein